ncbi:MAG: GAF and ANTAR domain-containing protein [Nocardioidaceae bacterium]
MDERDRSGGLTDAAVARIGRLCRRGAEAAGVDGAGVTMVTEDGSPQSIFSTDDLSGLLEELQFTLGEGPCVDATQSRSPVLIDDLAVADEAVAPRWTMFLNEAVSAGVRAVFAFPLGSGARTVGTLDLYRCQPGALLPDQLSHSLETADLVAFTLLSEGTGRGTDDWSGSLRMSVHQAAGMVMVQTGGSIDDALLLLRAASYGEGRPVHEIAAEVIDGHRRYGTEKP